MSLKYRNASGVETPIAGLNGTSGELVASASYIQSGQVSIGEVAANVSGTKTVTFTTPMPDTNYLVILSAPNGNSDTFSFAVRKDQQTVNGFMFAYTNLLSVAQSNVYVYWTAFKLITNEDRALDEQAITDLQTDKQNKTLDTPIVVNKSSRTTVEGTLSSLADIAVQYSISSPFGNTKYYRFKSTVYPKVNNLLITNRYSSIVGIFTHRMATEPAKSRAFRITKSNYGIAGIKLGQVTENETTYGIMYLKLTDYNPFTIIQLDNRTVANYVLTEITQQEYEAATSSTLSEFIEYTSLDDVPMFINSEHLSYSTSETFTGKFWIDGKPIYRKVVAITTSSTTSGNQMTNLGISNIDKVIKSSCSVKRPNTNDAYYSLPFTWGSANIGYWINTSSPNSFVSIQSTNVASSELSLEGYFIIEYTKTTD